MKQLIAQNYHAKLVRTLLWPGYFLLWFKDLHAVWRVGPGLWVKADCG